MKLIYGISDRPSVGKTLLFAFQQMIAIMAATLLVPMMVSTVDMVLDPAAALFGAGAGTIVYIICTKAKSPVFLGSSFTFMGAMSAAIAQNYGYWGLIIGVGFAGLAYVVIAIIIKFVGTNWINKLLPAVIIGPIVMVIGLSLSGTAITWVMYNAPNTDSYNLLAILCGIFTFFMIVLISTRGKKTLKLIPFIIGIGSGYLLALLLTVIGKAAGVEYMQILVFQPFIDKFSEIKFTSFLDYPKFTFLRAFETANSYPINASAIFNIAFLFTPIAIVELAQHIAHHKNLSSIVEVDLIKNPGLTRTLLGDGIGSIVGAFFGGCANTAYGESVGCVAISKNASTISIFTAAIGCMVLSFFTPFVAVINSIPKCVMGGACIAMYGFIAVSGLQMLKEVDLSDNRNLYVVASIAVTGIGGLAFNFGINSLTGQAAFSLTSVAAALIVGLITNLIVGKRNQDEQNLSENATAEETEEAAVTEAAQESMPE